MVVGGALNDRIVSMRAESEERLLQARKLQADTINALNLIGDSYLNSVATLVRELGRCSDYEKCRAMKKEIVDKVAKFEYVFGCMEVNTDEALAQGSPRKEGPSDVSNAQSHAPDVSRDNLDEIDAILNDAECQNRSSHQDDTDEYQSLSATWDALLARRKAIGIRALKQLKEITGDDPPPSLTQTFCDVDELRHILGGQDDSLEELRDTPVHQSDHSQSPSVPDKQGPTRSTESRTEPVTDANPVHFYCDLPEDRVLPLPTTKRVRPRATNTVQDTDFESADIPSLTHQPVSTILEIRGVQYQTPFRVNDCRINYRLGPWRFFIEPRQPPELRALLQDLQRQFSDDTYRANIDRSEVPGIGVVYSDRFKEFDRVSYIEFDAHTSLVNVQYTDWGNRDKIPFEKCFRIPEKFQSVPAGVVHCFLVPPGSSPGQKPVWPEDKSNRTQQQLFYQLTHKCRLHADLLYKIPSGTYGAALTLKDGTDVFTAMSEQGCTPRFIRSPPRGNRR